MSEIDRAVTDEVVLVRRESAELRAHGPNEASDLIESRVSGIELGLIIERVDRTTRAYSQRLQLFICCGVGTHEVPVESLANRVELPRTFAT